MDPKFLTLAQRYAKDTTTPNALKVATLAQWMLESGRGNSALAMEHNNFGGLKYRDRMVDYAESVSYTAHDGTESYCKFKDEAAFIAGYWHFIESGPYGGWQFFKEDAAGYINHIQKHGYCSQADYAAKIQTLFAEACTLLGLDSTAILETERDRPPRMAFGNWIQPTFETVAGVRHCAVGKRPNGLEGLIVHFDAGRTRYLKDGPQDSDHYAKETLRYGSGQGYHYGTISRTGRIFLPEAFAWDDYGCHAGKSVCPVTGRADVSRFYVGFELNNPGQLHETQEDGIYCPWFNIVTDPQTKQFVSKNGRVIRRSEQDEWYRADEVRYAEGGNIHPGWYLPFSVAQFEALTNLVCSLAAAFPGTFSIDRVFGHDEVAPARKNDPGGALAYPGLVMTMAAFRDSARQRL